MKTENNKLLNWFTIFSVNKHFHKRSRYEQDNWMLQKLRKNTISKAQNTLEKKETKNLPFSS